MVHLNPRNLWLDSNRDAGGSTPVAEAAKVSPVTSKLTPEVVQAIHFRLGCYFTRRMFTQVADNVIVHQKDCSTARMSVQALGTFYDLTLYADEKNVYWCLRGDSWAQPCYVEALVYTQELLKSQKPR
jgi:hypothetical protein